MTAARPLVAVVPFGARGADPRAGAWGRQLARRLVDRLADEPALELRPVFLVAMPESERQSGYLVFGSTPDPALAASYGASLGTSHALVGVYREEGGARHLDATLVSVAATDAVATLRLEVAAGELQLAEGRLAEWLAASLGMTLRADRGAPAANEAAYGALLEAMDEDVNETLLRQGAPADAEAAAARARRRYLDALRADPSCAVAAERLLVRAAVAMERGDWDADIAALEELVEIDPRSWRAQYVLGELRRERGDVNGAIVALEHSHALHPLRDADALRLAELYLAAGAPGPAGSHLRRIAGDSDEHGRAQALLGTIALGKGDAASAVARYREGLADGAPPATRLGLARALIALGDGGAAAAELDALVEREPAGEPAAHARRLRLGLRHPELERELEEAGRVALEGAADRLPDALASFERVLASDPDLWEAHFGAGLVARQSGDAEAAERAFRRVLELWPEQPDALHELGVALLMGEKTNDAIRVLERAASLRPGDAGYLADAGFALLRAGNLGAARERLELARGIDADDPVTRAYLTELARVEAEVGRTN